MKYFYSIVERINEGIERLPKVSKDLDAGKLDSFYEEALRCDGVVRALKQTKNIPDSVISRLDEYRGPLKELRKKFNEIVEKKKAAVPQGLAKANQKAAASQELARANQPTQQLKEKKPLSPEKITGIVMGRKRQRVIEGLKGLGNKTKAAAGAISKSAQTGVASVKKGAGKVRDALKREGKMVKQEKLIAAELRKQEEELARTEIAADYANAQLRKNLDALRLYDGENENTRRIG